MEDALDAVIILSALSGSVHTGSIRLTPSGTMVTIRTTSFNIKTNSASYICIVFMSYRIRTKRAIVAVYGPNRLAL
jgi:hypothetical protein